MAGGILITIIHTPFTGIILTGDIQTGGILIGEAGDITTTIGIGIMDLSTDRELLPHPEE
jgi:hypothetical protein